MKTLKIASLTAAVLQLAALAVSPAQAGTHEYLPASACVGTSIDGKIAETVWYQGGFAVNNHSSDDRDLLCPIRYEKLNTVSTSVIVRAVAQDYTNDPGGKVLAWICEAVVGENGSCVDVASTSDAYRGPTTLEMSLTPNSETRFLYLRVRLPDVDNDGHKSYFAGYRVCRGSC